MVLRIGGSQEGDDDHQRGMLFSVVGPDDLTVIPVFGRAVRVDRVWKRGQLRKG